MNPPGFSDSDLRGLDERSFENFCLFYIKEIRLAQEGRISRLDKLTLRHLARHGVFFRPYGLRYLLTPRAQEVLEKLTNNDETPRFEPAEALQNPTRGAFRGIKEVKKDE